MFRMSCFPVTRKTLVTKENSNMVTGARSFIKEDSKLILVPKPRLIWYLWNQFPLKAYFSSFGWILVQWKWLWRLQNTERKTTLMPLTDNNMANYSAKRRVTKGRLKSRSFCLIKKSFPTCFHFSLSKHWTWLNCIVLYFYNLYSGRFKFLYVARARCCFEQKVSKTGLCLRL